MKDGPEMCDAQWSGQARMHYARTTFGFEEPNAKIPDLYSAFSSGCLSPLGLFHGQNNPETSIVHPAASVRAKTRGRATQLRRAIETSAAHHTVASRGSGFWICDASP